jgi:peptidoglycan/xylan/chitin deacetylase (PgdA/CDA1 family)
MYHKVNDVPDNPVSVSTRQFDEQLHFLRQNHRVLAVDEAAQIIAGGYDFPARSVLLTFDDGYQDNLTNALPILEKYQCPAVLFLPTDYIGGGALPHDHAAPAPNPLLTWEEIATLSKVFSIGSHGCSHRILTRMPIDEACQEITRSRQIIEQHLGAAVRWFAYPYGSVYDFNDSLEQAVRQAGYDLCFTTTPGRNTGKFNRWRIRRYNVENFGLTYFRCLLDGSADVIGMKDTKLGYRAKALANRMLGIKSR